MITDPWMQGFLVGVMFCIGSAGLFLLGYIWRDR
jgi:hypothetical protein